MQDILILKCIAHSTNVPKPICKSEQQRMARNLYSLWLYRSFALAGWNRFQPCWKHFPSFLFILQDPSEHAFSPTLLYTTIASLTNSQGRSTPSQTAFGTTSKNRCTIIQFFGATCLTWHKLGTSFLSLQKVKTTSSRSGGNRLVGTIVTTKARSIIGTSTHGAS